MQKGYSLIEVLVVIGIFAVLGAIAAQSIAFSLRNSRKASSVIEGRQNLQYAVSVIERRLRNAQEITSCLPTGSTLSYTDEDGKPATFSCQDVGVAGSVGAVTSNLERVTSTNVNVTSCSFNCVVNGVGIPPTVTVSLEAHDAATTGIEGATYSITTDILLRNTK